MNWKHSTFILTGLLLITLLASYFVTSKALNAASIAEAVDRERQAEYQRLNSAVRDTESFLNFFRLIDSSELTADDYRHEIEILRMKYIAFFPNWAKSQVEIRDVSEDASSPENRE